MELLAPYKVQIIETLILIVSLVIIKLISRKSVNKILTTLHIDLPRKRLTQRVINLFLFITASIFIAGIWNIDQAQLMVFVTSIITILGIAFFAQWSVLSNITSSLILFFNHPLKIGEEIQILDKEYSIEGKLIDISFFFMHIRTNNGELVTIPNNLALQKVILIKKSS